jgi:hypothetical protein
MASLVAMKSSPADAIMWCYTNPMDCSGSSPRACEVDCEAKALQYCEGECNQQCWSGWTGNSFYAASWLDCDDLEGSDYVGAVVCECS